MGTDLGNGLAVKAKDNTSKILIAVLNVEVDLVGDLRSLASRLSSLSEVDKGEGQDDHHREEDTLNARHGDCVALSSRKRKSCGSSRARVEHLASEGGTMQARRAECGVS
jgi:hypothetical protein